MKGYFSEETLNNYARLAAEKLDVDFAEGDLYDFTTCIRPDGSAYGTGGKCRKGSEGEAKKKGKSDSEEALGKVKIVSPDTAKKMSDAELKSQVENANKAAFGKGSKVSPEVMKGLKEQHDIASNELASRGSAATKKTEQSVADKAMEMVKANARSRGLTEIKAGGNKPATPASTTKKPAVQGYDWRKQSGTFRKANND